MLCFRACVGVYLEAGLMMSRVAAVGVRVHTCARKVVWPLTKRILFRYQELQTNV